MEESKSKNNTSQRKRRKPVGKIGERVYIKPGRLVHTPWNPPSRCDATTHDFKKLCKSIERFGQQVPVIISPDGMIIDGNRRTAACAILQLKVECIVRGEDTAELYKELNAERKNIAGKDCLQIYIKEPRAAVSRVNSTFNKLQEEIGFYSLKMFAVAGGSLSTWNWAKKLAKYLSTKDIFPLAMWIVKFNQTLRIRKAIDAKVPPEVIWAHFYAEEQLNVDYTGQHQLSFEK